MASTCPDCNAELPVDGSDCLICAAYAEASAEMDAEEWRDWGTSPSLFPTTVRIASADEGGGREVPALTTPMAPGLAVTMAQFGDFNVTHVTSGFCLTTAKFERSCNALLILAKFSAIGVAYGVDFEMDHVAVKDAFEACGNQPVPFDRAITTGSDGSRPLTVSEWLRILGGSMGGSDEFPWETAEENPGNRAVLLLRSLQKAGSGA